MQVSPLLVAALLGAGFLAAAEPPGKSLRELARERGKEFGTNYGPLICDPRNGHAVKPNWQSDNARDLELIRRHFTMVGAGWQMFPGHSWLAPDRYCFDGSLAFIDWARANDLRVMFHGLGYIQRTWAHQPDGPAKATAPKPETLYDTPEKRAVFRDTYARYLDAFLKTFAGKVQSWDVLNEHVVYGSYTGRDGFNEFPYLAAWGANRSEPVYGIEYYLETLRRARALDPNAKLVYLDYNNEIICKKANIQYAATRELLARKAPIDAVGFQLHQSNNFNRERDEDPAGVGPEVKKRTRFHNLGDAPFLDRMRENVQRYADLGLEIWATELDVKAPLWQPVAERQERQAYVYRKLLEVCLEFPAYRTFKLWGTRDSGRDQRYGPGDGALFTDEGEPKPAFFAVQDAFANYHPTRMWIEGFEAAAPADWTLTDATVAAPAHSGQSALALTRWAAAERSVDLAGAYNAHLAYRWVWSEGPGDARVIVEAAAADGKWRELKRHDEAEFRLREGEPGWRAGFCTLDGFDGLTAVRVRFRREGPENARATFRVDDLALIADQR